MPVKLDRCVREVNEKIKKGKIKKKYVDKKGKVKKTSAWAICRAAIFKKRKII